MVRLEPAVIVLPLAGLVMATAGGMAVTVIWTMEEVLVAPILSVTTAVNP